jgi:hypothetical protein
MRHLYFSAITAALSMALATTPGRLAAQATTSDQTVASAQVTCKDGTSAQKGQGACSHHGGVVRMVHCKDGSTAKKGRGACSHHGGMAARGRASARANSNQTKSGVTDTKTGKSTLGKGVTQTSPDAGQPVTAKGDTLSRERGESTSHSHQ